MADVNGDGNLDLVAGNFGAINRLYLSDGAGGFSSGQDITSDAHNTHSLTLGDADRDGDLDLIVGNVNTENRLYLGDGSGGFSSGQT